MLQYVTLQLNICCITVFDRIKVYPFKFLLAELSTSSNFITAAMPENLPDFRYFANQEGDLLPMIAGSSFEAMFDPPFLIGIKFQRRILPIFDSRRRWIFVNTITHEVVPVTLHLYRIYSRAISNRILEKFQINNNGEYIIMPRNRVPWSRNVRRRHN